MLDDQLTITAIIPLYNGARFIEDSLNSVLAQTRPPQEILVVDDGSTDDGAAVVERFIEKHPQVQLLRKANGGQSAARNFAVKHSTGRLIALLDQDDMWYPHHLERLVEPFFKQRPIPLGWVYCNLDEVDITGQMVTRDALRALSYVKHPKRDLLGCLQTDMFVLPSASLISREAFEAVGGFDESLSGFEDDDLFLRIFRAGYDNVYIDEALTKWRIFTGSASFSARMARSRMIYVRKLLEMFPDQPDREFYYSRDAIAPRFLPWLVREYMMALRRGDTATALSAAEDLRFVAHYHRPRVRATVEMLTPILRRPALARTLLPVSDTVRPLLRRIFR
ncbi:MAG: glycosyltransferase family 2 protein [Rhodospirillales bacterium]|nr:glycosyltransferase family 2 protein [Rhodospirillales bacterium]